MPYLAAVPCVARCDGFFCERCALGFHFAFDVGGSILAAFAYEQSPRLTHPDLKVSRTAVLAVLPLTSKPGHQLA